MKFIIDTNVLFTYFWENSITRKLIMLNDFELFAPEFALEEINKHKPDIIKKTKISEKDFQVLKLDLAISVRFMPIDDYRDFLKDALEISPDSNDIDFFALALKMDLPLWSNDSLLKKQGEVKVLNTKEILGMIGDI